MDNSLWNLIKLNFKLYGKKEDLFLWISKRIV